MEMWDSEASWTSEILEVVKEDIENGTGLYGWEREQIIDIFKGFGKFFYVIDPEETSFEEAHQVPNFFRQVSLFNYIRPCCRLKNIVSLVRFRVNKSLAVVNKL